MVTLMMKLVQALATLSIALTLASVTSLFVTVVPSSEEAFNTLRSALFAATAVTLTATAVAFAFAIRKQVPNSTWLVTARVTAFGLAALVVAMLCVSTIA